MIQKLYSKKTIGQDYFHKKYEIKKPNSIKYVLQCGLFVTGLLSCVFLIGCQSSSLSAPCASFGKYCQKTPINPSIDAEKEMKDAS